MTAGLAGLNGAWGVAGACTVAAITLPLLPPWRNRDEAGRASGPAPPAGPRPKTILVVVAQSLAPSDLQATTMPFLHGLARTAIHGSMDADPPPADGPSVPPSLQETVMRCAPADRPGARVAQVEAGQGEDDRDVLRHAVAELAAPGTAPVVVVRLAGTRRLPLSPPPPAPGAVRQAALRELDERLASLHGALARDRDAWHFLVLGDAAQDVSPSARTAGLLVVAGSGRARGRNIGMRTRLDLAPTLHDLLGAQAPEAGGQSLLKAPMARRKRPTALLARGPDLPAMDCAASPPVPA